MNRSIRAKESGFTLLEVLTVMVIIGALASIALPYYIAYRERSLAVSCQSNRYHIEQIQAANYLENKTADLSIDPKWKCPSGGTYVWLISDPEDPGYPAVGCSIHSAEAPAAEERKYHIDLDPAALDGTIKEIFASFRDFVANWMETEGRMPVVNSANGSSSWNSPNYTGKDLTNLFVSKFWNDYYQYVGVEGFDAKNGNISDFKVFFDRDPNGNITSRVAGVYLQVGPQRRIFFSNGVTVAQQHYNNFIDRNARELVPPQ